MCKLILYLLREWVTYDLFSKLTYFVSLSCNSIQLSKIILQVVKFGSIWLLWLLSNTHLFPLRVPFSWHFRKREITITIVLRFNDTMGSLAPWLLALVVTGVGVTCSTVRLSPRSFFESSDPPSPSLPPYPHHQYQKMAKSASSKIQA